MDCCLCSRKDLRCPLSKNLTGRQGRAGHLEIKSLYPLLGIEPRIAQSVKPSRYIG